MHLQISEPAFIISHS